MTPRERKILQLLRDDFPHYASKCLKIRTKSGQVKPFELNKAQRFIHSKLEEQLRETGKVRALCLKGRQQGVSTLIGARFYHKVTWNKGMQAFILTHALDATQNLYKMAQRFYENTPVAVRPQVTTSNAKELIFGLLDSGYKLGTAENKAVGRSATIQLLHGSETGFWSNAAEHAKGIMQAVPSEPNTEIILESTANGVGNFFHEQWQSAEAGMSDYIAIFVPWYWQDEYKRGVPDNFSVTIEEEELRDLYQLTPEQLVWRRYKIAELGVNGQDGEKAFLQEYPNCAQEAFVLTGEDSFIETGIVMKARTTIAEKYGPLLIGVDPARFGDDRTSIIRRQGRVAYGLESYTKKDTMEIVGIVHQIIQSEEPVKVFIDVGGLGAGVVDRLIELGHRDIIVSVNAGASPLDSRKYSNKRSEMWGLLKQWLQDEPCQIPDSNSLHADICNIKYKVDSNSRLVMEQKAEMKKRGVRSPDCFIAGTLIKTPTGEIPIDKLKEGDLVITPFGATKIIKLWTSETDELTTVNFTNGSQLCGKGAHKIFNWKTGACRLDELSLTFAVEAYSKWSLLKWQLLKPLLTKARNSEFKPLVDTINRTIGMRKSAFYIVAFGQIISAPFRKIMSCITKITIGAITTLTTLKLWINPLTQNCTCENISPIQKTKKKIEYTSIMQCLKQRSGTNQQKAWHGMQSMANEAGTIVILESPIVRYVIKSLKLIWMPNFVRKNADKKVVIKNKKQSRKSVYGVIKNFLPINTGKWNVAPSSVRIEDAHLTKVYNLTLEKHNVYYANNILVFNCADSLCLTFALPVTALTSSSKSSQVAGTIMQQQRALEQLRRGYGGNRD